MRPEENGIQNRLLSSTYISPLAKTSRISRFCEQKTGKYASADGKSSEAV